MKHENLAAALAHALDGSPARIHTLWRFGLTFPVIIVLWYAFGSMVLERASVALTALLLMFLYGTCMSLLTMRAVLVSDSPQGVAKASASRSDMFGEAIARRVSNQVKIEGSAGLPEREQEDSTPEVASGGDQKSLFPLRG